MIPIGTEIRYDHVFSGERDYLKMYAILEKDESEREQIHLEIGNESMLAIPISCVFKGIGKRVETNS